MVYVRFQSSPEPRAGRNVQSMTALSICGIWQVFARTVVLIPSPSDRPGVLPSSPSFPRKRKDYLLSPTHQDGRNKLRLWRSDFAIEGGDADLLDRLLREQLPQAQPEERPPKVVREPERLIRQWQLLIPNFRGPNGNEGPVKIGWALDASLPQNAARPHLTNAYPDV